MHAVKGFSLVELAIVLVVVGLMLGGLLMPLAAQVDQARIGETQKLLQQIHEALLGFAITNQRLPCPALPTTVGAEDPACTAWHGFVPAATLALSGSLNEDGLLLDSWGNPIRYSVTRINHPTLGNTGVRDFTSLGDMRAVGMANLAPDLTLCNTSTGATATACAAGNDVTTNAVAVLFSMGKDWSSFSSPDQLANVGATLGGGPSGLTYQVPAPADRVFISREYRLATGTEFDDILIWISPNILFNRMVMAGRLP